MSDPTETEIKSIRTGKCQFKLVVRDQVIFLMAKFADMYWMDAPYSIHLLPEEQRKLCSEFTEGKRYGLIVMLINSRTNDQCGSRLVSWDPHFSAMFHGSVKSQLAGRFSQREHDQTIRTTYASFTSSKLCSMALAHTAGIDLPLALRAGRPAKDDAEKRRVNAERQRRFRARRRADWRRLQALLAGR